MQIKNLVGVNFKAIVDCFNEAFAKYFVPINATETYLSTRWKGARIQPELSYGVFDKEKLVAFIFIGIDIYHGKLTAHNDGTGVLPAYRGNRLVDKMYEVAIPNFKKAGVEQCTLEVIQENIRAQRVYERIGFEKIRALNCYSSEFQAKSISPPSNFKIEIVEKAKWQLYQTCFDFTPAWNSAIACIKLLRTQYKIIELSLANEFIGFAIVNDTGSLPLFGIHPAFRRCGFGRILLEYISQSHPILRSNNIDATSTASIQFLEAIGMRNTINQYEMCRKIHK